jgi:hypothetical protein
MFEIKIIKKNNPDKAVAYSNDNNRRPLKNSAFPPSPSLSAVYRKHWRILLLFKELRNMRENILNINILSKYGDYSAAA